MARGDKKVWMEIGTDQQASTGPRKSGRLCVYADATIQMLLSGRCASMAVQAAHLVQGALRHGREHGPGSRSTDDAPKCRA